MKEFTPSPPHDIIWGKGLPWYPSDILWWLLIAIVSFAILAYLSSKIKQRSRFSLDRFFIEEITNIYFSSLSARQKLNEFAKCIRRTLQISYGDKFVSLTTKEMYQVVSEHRVATDIIKVLEQIDEARFARELSTKVLDEAYSALQNIRQVRPRRFWRTR